ncbi:MAG: helix-turn-helix domain-containing protein [Actinomycetota bacterium]|nr:helix-turn-helix domain-containing protein [Actinomycetota bacterium]
MNLRPSGYEPTASCPLWSALGCVGAGTRPIRWGHRVVSYSSVGAGWCQWCSRRVRAGRRSSGFRRCPYPADEGGQNGGESVQDLVHGPRRFTDLFDGLPGISTDLLTDRLRSLETAGAVRRREVRTPVPAQLYELTDRGVELARLAGQLARWGAPLLPDIADAGDRVVNVRWILQSRASRYRGGLPDGDVHFLIDGTDELTLSLTGDFARLRYGHSEATPLLALEGPTHAVVTLLSGADELDPLSPDVAVDGQTELLGPLVAALRG